MDEGIKYTYIQVLKHGWKIKQSLLDRILYKITGRFRYHIQGDWKNINSALTVCGTNRADIELPWPRPAEKPKEYSINAFAYNKTEFYELPT